MKELKELLQNKGFEETKAHNERQDLIDKTSQMLERPYKQVATLLKGKTTDFIRDRYLEVQGADNPPALWWYLRKKRVDK